MINLNELKPAKKMLPPRFIVHGDAKVGKTTFTTGMPNPIIFDIDGNGGSENLNVVRLDKDTEGFDVSYDGIMTAIGQLYTQEHSFNTLSIDSADWLEKLLIKKVCDDAKVDNIGKISHGKGYIELESLFKNIIDGMQALRDKKKMMVGFVCHTKVNTYDNTLGEDYHKSELKMTSRCQGLLEEWADIIVFATLKTYTKKQISGFGEKHKAVGDERVALLNKSPSYLAGNRYNGFPAELPLEWQAFSNAFAELNSK